MPPIFPDYYQSYPAADPPLDLKHTIVFSGDTEDFIDDLENTGYFAYVIEGLPSVPDHCGDPCQNPVTINDPLADWMLESIDAYCAWSITTGSPNIEVAVIDTEFDLTNPDLVNKARIAADFNRLSYYCAHGTSVASMICAEPNNGTLIAGAGYNTKVAGYIVDYGCGGGLDRALNAALNDGQRIINLSWREFEDQYDDIIQELVDKGALVVVSGGNSSSGVNGPVQWPTAAGIPGVISVSAVQENSGSPGYIPQARNKNSTIDILAPGINVVRLNRPDPITGSIWAINSGTSLSCPIVSAVAGLMLDVNPCLTGAEMETILKETACPAINQSVYDGVAGTGVVNAYAAVLAADGHIDPISTSVTWDSPRYVSGDFVIESGGVLTITSKIRFAEDGGIIVEEGGSLRVEDGGILTRAKGFCDDDAELWEGIDVYGTGSFSGSGRVTVKSGGKIEYARTGISSISGGIVFCSGAEFYNNKRSIEFLRCPGYSFYEVVNSNFEVDDNLPEGLIAHVTLWSVRNVKFTGDTFIDNRSAPEDGAEGIFSIDANYIVSGGCLFYGLEDGIEATNSITTNSISVIGNTFQNNQKGVQIRAVDHVRISGNQFTGIGRVNLASPGNQAYGVFISRSTGYKVYENRLEGSSQSNVSTKVGILADDTGFDNNKIEKDTFVNLTFGNIGDKNNGSGSFSGLVYLCNDNSNVAVADIQSQGGGIRQIQWRDATHSAGNLFSHTAADLRNRSNFLLWYWYEENISREIPQIFLGTRIVDSENSGCSTFDEPDFPGVVQEEDFIVRRNQHKSGVSNYNTVISTYNSNIDDGDTQTLLDDISNNDPNIYSTLVNISPWLSVEVLEAVLNAPSVFTSNEMTNIFSLNPEGMRSNGLMADVNSSGYFTETQLNYIDSLTLIPTDRLTMEGQIGDYKGQIDLASDMALQYLLKDSSWYNLDSIEIWLQRKNSLSSQYGLINAFMQKGDTTSAKTTYNDIPSNFELNTTEIDDHDNFEELLDLSLELFRSERDFSQLDTPEVAILENLADLTDGRASLIAQNILNFFYGYDYQINIDIEDPSGLSSKYSLENNFVKDETTEEKVTNIDLMSIVPNPASSIVTFHFNLPMDFKDKRTRILARKTTGEIIKEFEVSYQGSISWDISTLTKGIYFIYLESDKTVIEVQKLLIL